MLIGIHTTPQGTENVDFFLLLSGNPADLLEDKNSAPQAEPSERVYNSDYEAKAGDTRPE